MELFDLIFGKKKKSAKFVIDKEDDQSEFLKTDEEMKGSTQKKTAQNKVEAPKSTSDGNAKNAKIEKNSSAEEKIRQKRADTSKQSSKPENKEKASQSEDDIDLEKTVSVKEGKETKSGKFDIRRAKDGRFFFCLYASNHAPIAYSQIYSTSSAALNVIDSIIANSPKSGVEDTTLKNPKSLPFPKWEIYIDKAGEYRFRLYAVNGNCICHASHGYSTKSGCKGGMESITRFAKEAKVDKSYLK